MTQNWTVQTEKGEHSARAAWATLQGQRGSRKAAVVLSTASEAAAQILASGMLYLQCEADVPVLFQIESTAAARISGCLLIRAREVQNPSRSLENAVLRELRALFQLDMTENAPPALTAALCHEAAS